LDRRSASKIQLSAGPKTKMYRLHQAGRTINGLMLKLPVKSGAVWPSQGIRRRRPPVPPGGLCCGLLWAALSCVLLFCLGCHTAGKTLFTASGPGWRVQEGQALWRPRRGYPELGGDLVLAGDGQGRHLIQFAKTPMSLVSAQTTRTDWLIDFPPKGIGFRGHRQRPTRFVWLYLPTALAGEPPPEPLRFQREADNAWRLENTRTGETLKGYLAP
jgi:hypothetical protein